MCSMLVFLDALEPRPIPFVLALPPPPAQPLRRVIRHRFSRAGRARGRDFFGNGSSFPELSPLFPEVRVGLLRPQASQPQIGALLSLWNERVAPAADSGPEVPLVHLLNMD